jgi:hypothetical protein
VVDRLLRLQHLRRALSDAVSFRKPCAFQIPSKPCWNLTPFPVSARVMFMVVVPSVWTRSVNSFMVCGLPRR